MVGTQADKSSFHNFFNKNNIIFKDSFDKL